MTIAAILETKGDEVLTVSVDTPVGEAVALLDDRKIGAVPVVRGGGLVGTGLMGLVFLSSRAGYDDEACGGDDDDGQG